MQGSKGDPTFFNFLQMGSNYLFAIEIHIHVTCDFPGGLVPVPPSESAHASLQSDQHLCYLFPAKYDEFEPVHEISNNVLCATSKASDQPAHMCSLIRAFARHLNIL